MCFNCFDKNRRVVKHLTVLCTFLLSISCSAQEITTEKLNGTKWKRVDKEFTLEFASDSITEILYDIYTNRTIRVTKPYYLTDNKNEPFDNAKVGLGTKGIYLFRYNIYVNGIEDCKIMEFTEDKLVLFYEEDENYIGGADISFTYKRVH